MYEFTTLMTNLQTDNRLNQRVKPVVYSGVEFKEGEQYNRVNFDQSLMVNIENYMNQVYNCDHMTLDQVRGLVLPNVPLIIDNLVNYHFGHDYSKIFTNQNVLTIIREYVSNLKEVDMNLVMSLDTLIYRSILRTNDEKLLMHYKGLASEVNKNIISQIMAINTRGHNTDSIDRLTATYIALTRYSDFDPTEIRLVERVNNVVRFGNNAPRVFSVQIMIDLYCMLFDKLSGITHGTFFKSLEFLNAKETDDMRKVKNNQIIAALNILNSHNYDLIKTVLTDFANRYYSIYQGNPFYLELSLRTLDRNTYQNILNVVQDLNTVGVIVP